MDTEEVAHLSRVDYNTHFAIVCAKGPSL